MAKTRPETFDLLDAHCKEERAPLDTASNRLRFPHFMGTFIIDPRNWEKHFPPLSSTIPNWNEYKYSSRPDLSTIIASNDPGVYVFYIKPPNTILGMPQFVLYVGISNENNSNRPLKERLADYFRVESIKKRNMLHRLLCQYYDYTYVAYCTMSLSTSDMKHIETNLIGFYCPLANKDDYPAEIEASKKAFNK